MGIIEAIFKKVICSICAKPMSYWTKLGLTDTLFKDICDSCLNKEISKFK